MTEPRRDRKSKHSVMVDWREVTKKMTTDEQYQCMQEHCFLTDCTFVVGPKDGKTRQFKAHRLHIARVSPVFEAMLLRGEMVEAKTGHVRVTDLSPDTFQLLLNFIYGKEPETTSYTEAEDLAFAAHKYQIKALLQTCVMRMSALITPENIWTPFATADLLQETRLKETCVKILQFNTLRCIKDPSFMQASEENVALLLQQDELNVDDELKVGNELTLVNVIVQWARHAAFQRGLSADDSGVRAVLEPRLLKLLRFLAMSYQQFMLGPGLSGWLTSNEKSAISECLRSRDFSNWPQHLSSVTEKRRKVVDMADTVQILGRLHLEKFICKRKITDDSRPSVRESSQSNCSLCQLANADLPYCLHAYLIFRVKSVCKFLGFQCTSRRMLVSGTDPTALWAKNPVYQENICGKLLIFNHTLLSCFKKTVVDTKQMDNHLVEYNSSVSIMFDNPIPLVTDNWFGLEVVYRHGANERLGLYPNPECAQSVCTEAGVEVVFFTENLYGYHQSKCDGIFQSLIFAL